MRDGLGAGWDIYSMNAIESIQPLPHGRGSDSVEDQHITVNCQSVGFECLLIKLFIFEYYWKCTSRA